MFDQSSMLDHVQNMFKNFARTCSVPAVQYNENHVRSFFETDLHEVSWHLTSHEAVRPTGF